VKWPISPSIRSANSKFGTQAPHSKRPSHWRTARAHIYIDSIAVSAEDLIRAFEVEKMQERVAVFAGRLLLTVIEKLRLAIKSMPV
jgi:hypothetical protein